MRETKSDITYAISVVSQFIKNLSRQYNEAMKTIICYLKVTKFLGITYSSAKGS